MKTYLKCLIILMSLLLGLGRVSAADEGRDWDKDPLLKSIHALTYRVMTEYEAWAEEWAKGNKVATEKDHAINRIAEGMFVSVITSLGVAPNPEFAADSMRFLDTKIPPEFEELWRFVFIEIGNVARDKEGRRLKSEQMENLGREAMGKK